MTSDAGRSTAPRPAATFAFEAIGTHWTIDLFDTPADPDALLAAVYARIDTFDRAYSRFRADSLVTRMSREAGTYTLPDDAPPMLALYAELYRLTDGAMTPLIGNVMAQAGYDAAYSLQPGALTAPPAWEDALAVEGARVTMKLPTMLDFGAAGKGYLVDIVAGVLAEHGVRAFTIDAGGDMLHRGGTADGATVSAQTIRVGMEDPADATKVIGVVTLSNESICCSAGNRRAWANFHHIINPHLLASPREVLSVWVVAETTLLADALATALFFAPPERLRARFAFEHAILYADRSLARSPGFRAEIFTS